jgi:hypothetical protein
LGTSKKPNVLVFALRDWSYENILPVIKELSEFNFKRIYTSHDQNLLQLIPTTDLFITCEPFSADWYQMFSNIRTLSKKTIIALQQSPYYTETNKEGTFNFDVIFTWGRQTKTAWVDYCGLDNDKAIVTGCPRHDKMFGMPTCAKNAPTVLLSGIPEKNKELLTYVENPKYNAIVHPRFNPGELHHKLTVDTLSIIRDSKQIYFTDTGPGIWALILKKDCKVFGNYDNYKYWNKPFFIEWSVTDNQATKRIAKLLKEYI